MVVERDHRLNILLSKEEFAMLRALADDAGFSVSDLVRQFARRAYAEKFGDKKPPKAKP